jgi:hypothetical protein
LSSISYQEINQLDRLSSISYHEINELDHPFKIFRFFDFLLPTTLN